MSTSGILKDKAIKSVGGMEEFKRKSELYRENLIFLESHKPEILKTHDGKWIAIFNASLVASSDNLSDLLKSLDKQTIPKEEALIQFLSSEDILTLYPQ